MEEDNESERDWLDKEKEEFDYYFDKGFHADRYYQGDL